MGWRTECRDPSTPLIKKASAEVSGEPESSVPSGKQDPGKKSAHQKPTTLPQDDTSVVPVKQPKAQPQAGLRAAGKHETDQPKEVGEHDAPDLVPRGAPSSGTDIETPNEPDLST